MTPLRGLLILCLLSPAFAIIACGDSGPDPSTPVSELDTAELESICRSYYHAPAGVSDTDFARWQCYVQAIVLHDDSPGLFPDCEQLALDCIEESGAEEPEDCELDESDRSDLPECASDVTAGELQDCFDAVADQIRDGTDEVSCQLTVDDVGLPAACSDIETRCPELLEK
jgi:hypothetical protein